MKGEHPGLELTFSEVDVGAGVQLGLRETRDWDLNGSYTNTGRRS